ncbi:MULTISPECIES: tyrosine--tRNA ligase [unclassified Wenzhouxiangella]|uniref:tyrosine--tRNA ligase n=1 Tax=unclassified Wenzhouxiangella TaxID=2613841 RepID=UPI000E32B4A8|nr:MULTISPECIES: tyrosine--tRNA ligase [unclassified Wenzhouxiangella]RFF26576.1 tyrosine--tRNA ligase [Wenzhouxiangella sp. 15181]RFP70191.1 tyrosine--tRNA ligase [Wenzhouxiangella sp. 15190]
MTDIKEIIRGAAEIIQVDELEKRLDEGRPLRIKVGFDPTAPDLHLGHTVILNAMRRFQDAGHTVIFLIGDFTGMIGDPTGKNVTRKPLTEDDVRANAQTYREQVFKILDRDKTEVRFNSEWFSDMSAADMIRLASQHTVARMLERDDFEKRYRANQAIAIHEFLYPLVQGHDSVALKADIEMGGTDQKFNLLVGRQLQQQAGQAPQVIITWPLLEGTDGVQKMSKSLDNYVGINESADDMFGKLMSISDELMWRYFELLSFRPIEDIEALQQAVADGGNPRDAKFALAMEIVDRFHGEGAGEKARDRFIARFRGGQMPEDMPEKTLPAEDGGIGIAAALTACGLTASNSEAFRMIKQGAVKIDGEKVEDRDRVLGAGFEGVLQVGKRRFARLTVQD